MAEKSQITFLWKQIRDKAEGIIPPVSFNAFIKDLEPVDIINRRIYLKAPTELAANTILKKHAVSLRDAISKSDSGWSSKGAKPTRSKRKRTSRTISSPCPSTKISRSIPLS